MQLLLLQPKLALLDETDSGLDMTLKVVAEGVNRYRSEDNGVVLIPYRRLSLSCRTLCNLSNGKIIESGDKSLALELEAKGYAWLT